jgi:NAD(P)-dependent dehydrogenase (short-subunit alcohol dehydrogenase family)
MDLGLKDRVAIVTGAGSQKGFGRGIALTLAREGCNIVVSDIDAAGMEQTAQEIRALNRKAITIKADITNKAEVDNMVQLVIARFGQIDILVNNAGGSTPPQLFAETNPEKWRKDIDLNLIGVLNCTRAVVPHMITRKRGDIVSIASLAGVAATPTGTTYGVAKAGVISFTQSLAQELQESGIKVNCLAPAFGFTAFYEHFPVEWAERGKKMQAEGRTITPEDIGNTVAFLASDISLKITGQCIQVSGAMPPRK